MQDIESPLHSDDKLSRLYACAFQKWKTNYRIGQEYYYPKERNVIDYIKTKPNYFEFNKVKGDWKIRSKIGPLIEYIEELVILNNTSPSHKELLKDMFKGNKNELRRILDTSAFRNYIEFEKGFNSINEIINLVGLIATISYSSKLLYKEYNIKVSPDKAKQLARELTNKTMENAKKIDKSISDKQAEEQQSNFNRLVELGETFSKFKPIFLIELSKVSKISSYIYYTIIGSHSIAKTLGEYKHSTH